MNQDHFASRWLDPQVLSAVGSMEFLAQQVVEGFITGLHTSPYRGYNQEFAEHRPYQSGDELRYVDWKLFGRTDRFFVKQFEADTNLRATLVLDASASMNFSGKDTPWTGQDKPTGHKGLTKFDYARMLAACLTYILNRQRDATGLTLIDKDIRQYIPSRGSRGHLRYIMEALDQAQPGGETSLASCLEDLALRLHRRSLIILISDLIDNPEAVLSSLSLMRHRKHEVIVFHLVDPMEWNLEYEGGLRFWDSESADFIDSDPVRLRQGYKKEMESIKGLYREGCLEHHITYEWVLTDTPLELLLPSFLAGRRS